MKWAGVTSPAVKLVLMAQLSHHSFEPVYVLKKTRLNFMATLCAQVESMLCGPAVGGPCCGGIKWFGFSMSGGDACLFKCDNIFWITMSAVIQVTILTLCFHIFHIQ